MTVIRKHANGSNDRFGFNSQLEGFKQVLIPTLTQAQFADMYAQTVTYGMFIARLQDNSNDSFSRSKASSLIPKSNPFLQNFFDYITGINIDESIKCTVDFIADMFNYVEINNIRKEFESKNKDPFIHFYEDFLIKYSKAAKDLRGAYYTPIEVVDFIVRGVDDLLKTEFGIADGLADDSKVTINSNQIPKIQILDPATGTGTFLAQAVRQIYKSFGAGSGDWNDQGSRMKNKIIQ
ncbi:MAG: N-6 DNA methylase [Dysgonamonadaceae bacterium]|jgi:predicted helicase|nr:N-6 DNA methylase [Dysgonamonadaceae bacterium]